MIQAREKLKNWILGYGEKMKLDVTEFYDPLLTRSCFLCNTGRNSEWIISTFYHEKKLVCLPVHKDCLIDSIKKEGLREEIKAIFNEKGLPILTK